MRVSVDVSLKSYGYVLSASGRFPHRAQNGPEHEPFGPGFQVELKASLERPQEIPAKRGEQTDKLNGRRTEARFMATIRKRQDLMNGV